MTTTSVPSRSVRFLFLGLLAGCAMEPADPTIDGPPGDLDGFIGSLPSWIEVSPPVEESDAPVTESVELPVELASDGTPYRCTTTTYELSRNPSEIAMASPDAAVIWPGALLRGDAHLGRGATELLAVSRERRAPMGISLQGGGVLGIRGGVSATIEEPIGSTVREGINQLVANALASDVATGAGASSFRSVETFTSEQALLSLGFDARYLGASVEAAFEAERAVDQHTLTATFVQRLFTVSVDAPERPSDVFAPEVTARELLDLGVGPDNLPLYIDSVSYGRMLMVSMTSTESIERLEAALSFTYEGVVAEGSAYAEVDLRRTLSSATIEVFALGGPNTGVESLIASGRLGDYFDGTFAINQVEPISFTVRDLADNRVASVAGTTRYELERCEEVLADRPEPSHWYPMEGDLSDVIGVAHVTPYTTLDYTAGRSGQSAVFASDFPARAMGEQPIERGAPFAISVWVRPARDDAYMTLAAVNSQDRKAGDFQLRLGPNNSVAFFRRLAGGSDVVEIVRTPNQAVPVGRWTHVTAVYGAGDDMEDALRIYIDGVLVDATPSVDAYRSEITAYEGLSLGAGDGVLPRWTYTGALDELMTFDRALSSDEVWAHFARFDEYVAP